MEIMNDNQNADSADGKSQDDLVENISKTLNELGPIGMRERGVCMLMMIDLGSIAGKTQWYRLSAQFTDVDSVTRYNGEFHNRRADYVLEAHELGMPMFREMQKYLH
ncbi:MAG: hypothetical protein NT001_02310, partial [Candidatus Woesearchaeota archaeon]|nr:hypothetical protein [Candidatus Woesearchaeota archaeon]